MAGSALRTAFSGWPLQLLKPLQRVTACGANRALLLLGAVLICLLAAIAVLSPAFVYGRVPGWDETLIFVGLLTAAGAVFAVSFVLVPLLRSSGTLLAAIVLVGFIARFVFLGSTPIYEDDWYRYLWDGAVVSAGINPYMASPAQAMLTDLEGNAVSFSGNAEIARLQLIGADHPHFPERVNYPYVTTIYPPIALAAFAGAHQLSPFSLDAFRLVLIASDTVALALLIFLLRFYGRNPLWSVLYWWNPIIIVTGFNAGHMDILLAPFLLGAVILAENLRPRFAAIALAAAVGIKLWPIILVPIIFRAWRKDFKEIIVTGSVFTIAIIIFAGPLLMSLQSQHSGLAAYASDWITNSFFFTYASAGLSLFAENGDQYLRLAVAAIVSTAALWFALSRRGNETSMPTAIMLTVLLLFFLSPTGYPWYALWFFLYAPFAPMAGVTLLAVTLPIYYLRFLMSESGWEVLFNYGLTPIEFGLPLAVLIYELRKKPPWRA